MKRLASLFLIALFAVMLPLVVPGDATAQDQVYVTPAAEFAATDVINGLIVSTVSVELDGEMYRVSEIEISSAPKGGASGSVLVETPGGERPDGSVVYVSHTPKLEDGELVQLALVPADHDLAYALPLAAGSNLPVFSVVNGLDGAYGLLPDGVGRAEAVGDYALTGSSWPDFAPPVDFWVNPSNSGVSTAETIAGVRAAFDLWENDAGSNIDFTYRGTTTKNGLDLSDDQVVVSFASYSSGWLAQASWIASGGGDILSFDVRVNTDFQWSNGAASGRYDIGTVVGHEVGHGIGLNHAPASSELMYFQIAQANAKPLGAGDQAGARVLYTNPTFGQIVEPGHSVASNPSGDVASAHVKEDGRLFLRTDIGSQSAKWEQLGSVDNWISTDVSLDSAGNLQLAGLKADGVLFTRYRAASGVWSTWVNHGGGWSLDTMPSIAMNLSGSTALAAVGATGQLQVKTGVGSSWSSWETQGSGGWAQVDIDIADDGDLWFVGVKFDGSLFVRKDIGSGWSNFRKLGLPTWSSDTPPAIGAYQTGVVVGAVKADGRMYTIRQSNNVWQNWVRQGLSDWSSIDLVVAADGDLGFVGVKDYGRLFLRTQANGAWSSWTRLGLDTWSDAADVSVAFIRGDDPILVGVKDDGVLFMRQRVNSTWAGWQGLGLGDWAAGQ